MNKFLTLMLIFLTISDASMANDILFFDVVKKFNIKYTEVSYRKDIFNEDVEVIIEKKSSETVESLLNKAISVYAKKPEIFFSNYGQTMKVEDIYYNKFAKHLKKNKKDKTFSINILFEINENLMENKDDYKKIFDKCTETISLHCDAEDKSCRIISNYYDVKCKTNKYIFDDVDSKVENNIYISVLRSPFVDMFSKKDNADFMVFVKDRNNEVLNEYANKLINIFSKTKIIVQEVNDDRYQTYGFTDWFIAPGVQR